MATKSYSLVQYFKVMATDEVVPCGRISDQSQQQLEQVIVMLLKHGTNAGTERIRCKLFHDASLTKLYATGDWFDIADISNLSLYWRGRVGLTFMAKPWLQAGANYYVAVEVGNYARSGDAYYLALSYDWPEPVNSVQPGALYMEIRGQRKVSYF